MNRMSKNITALSIVICLSVVMLAACGSTNDTDSDTTYQQITQEEAAQIMAEEDDIIILDVRMQEEYAEGHIPGAICIPNETIGTDEIAELPDKDQTILVYCRSGNRSKQASEKLAALGYTDIREFGGINTWPGEIEK